MGTSFLIMLALALLFAGLLAIRLVVTVLMLLGVAFIRWMDGEGVR